MKTQHEVDGVETTAGGVLRATMIAAVIGAAILFIAWLPAEYGLDPTGAGRVLGLTEMGEIKQQLAQEADAEAQQTIDSPPISADLDARLSAIEDQIAAIAAAVSVADRSAASAPEPTGDQPVPASDESLWRDESSYVLSPGEGIEVKLVMRQGEVATFEWDASGAVLNHDTHGNGGGERIMYERGRGVPNQAGELEAAFDGRHGWFWRNRTDGPVTLTLRTGGEYAQLIGP
jgi:hypothetical protein